MRDKRRKVTAPAGISPGDALDLERQTLCQRRWWPRSPTRGAHSHALIRFWRAPLGYQESGFNPNARSGVGAKGLMQVMPRSGPEMEITDLEDPGEGPAASGSATWSRPCFS